MSYLNKGSTRSPTINIDMIQPILGVAEILRSQSSYGNEADDSGEVKVSKSEISMLIRNAERFESLSSELLMATKIDSQGIALNIEKIDMVRVVKEAVEDAQLQVRKTKSHTEIFFDNHSEEPIFVDADNARILQVLTNILNNGIKFAKGGVIRVSVETPSHDSSQNHGGLVVVKVKDNGRGIDGEIMPRLFSKFASRSSGAEGTGLGLYIAKSIVDAHGGRIWGENNRDGKGATFAFGLPIHRAIKSEHHSHDEPISSGQSQR